MSHTSTVWAGLGQRGDASAAPPPPDAEAFDDGRDDFERPSIKRIVPAASAPSVLPAGAVASPFDHPFRPGARSVPAPAKPDAAPQKNHQEKTMPKKPTERRPRPTRGASARFQVCALLMAKGDLSRDELKADVSADDRAFGNAIFNAKAAGHIVYVEKIAKYRITRDGKEWTSGGANLGNQRAAGSSPREVKHGRRQPREKSATLPKREKKLLVSSAYGKARKKRSAETAGALAVVESAPMQVVQERSFRCAVYSDGGFFLAKSDQRIELNADEHREMLRYLERMADEQAASHP